MNTAAIVASVEADIETQLHSHHPQPAASVPATISSGLAVALLQKSIRRGRTDLALAAANALLTTAPDRLWRRLAVIAIEDVGLAGPAQVYETVVSAAHWRRLARRWGAPRLVSLIVSRLAASPKCRGADDLFVVATDCPAWDKCHLELAEMTFGDLLDVIAGDGRLERRAIALRLAMGAETVAGAARKAGRHRHEAVFDFLCDAGFPHTLVAISRLACRLSREPFCAFLPLLHREFDSDEAELVSDDFPHEANIGGMPSWCLDGFSREGRKALVRFLASDCDTSRWLRVNVSPQERMKVLRHAQFRVEAGLVADRLIWPTGVDLRRQADVQSWSFSPADAATLLFLMQDDIVILNTMREMTNGR